MKSGGQGHVTQLGRRASGWSPGQPREADDDVHLEALGELERLAPRLVVGLRDRGVGVERVAVLGERGDAHGALGEGALERVERGGVAEQAVRVGVGVAEVVARGELDALDAERGDPVQGLLERQPVVQHRQDSDLHALDPAWAPCLSRASSWPRWIARARAEARNGGASRRRRAIWASATWRGPRPARCLRDRATGATIRRCVSSIRIDAAFPAASRALSKFTSKDVARVAGVSQSTVSYVLTGKRPISEETRRRVLDAIEHLTYEPNAGARALASQRTSVIGLVVPFHAGSDPPGVLPFIETIANAARERDHDVLLVTSDEGSAGLRRLAGRSLCDAIVLMDIEAHDERIPVGRVPAGAGGPRGRSGGPGRAALRRPRLRAGGAAGRRRARRDGPRPAGVHRALGRRRRARPQLRATVHGRGPRGQPSGTGCRTSSSRRSSRRAPVRRPRSSAPSPRAATTGSASSCPTARVLQPLLQHAQRARPRARSRRLRDRAVHRRRGRARASRRSPTCPRSRATSRGVPWRRCSGCSSRPSRGRRPRSS